MAAKVLAKGCDAMQTKSLLGLILLSALAGAANAEDGWCEDLESAKAKAAEERKDLLLFFTGSDWCPYCAKLKSEVFDQEAFKTEAPKQYVLVALDYPRSKKQADAVKKQNALLRPQYKIEVFPTVVLADAHGRPYAQTGYRPGGPGLFLETLEQARKRKQENIGLLKKAEAAVGAEKAKLLDKAIANLQANGLQSGYDDLAKALIEADADGAAGLKAKHEIRMQLREAQSAAAKGDLSGAMAQAEAVLNHPDSKASDKQQALMIKANLLYLKKDKAGAFAAYKAAKAADPDSDQGRMVDSILEQLQARDSKPPMSK
jgi:thioredoxin-related protein